MSKLMPFLKTAVVVLAVLFIASKFLPESIKSAVRI